MSTLDVPTSSSPGLGSIPDSPSRAPTSVAPSRSATPSELSAPPSDMDLDMDLDMVNTMTVDTPSRVTKRRRTSISSLNILDQPEASSTMDSDCLTPRHRRQAALDCRSKVQSALMESTSPIPFQNVKIKEKQTLKPKTTAEGKQRAKKVEVMEEYYECPCGNDCETFAICENRKKGEAVRDVCVNVIMMGSNTMVRIQLGTNTGEAPVLIHKDLLTLHSKYFDSLFSQSLESAIQHSINQSNAKGKAKAMDGNRVEDEDSSEIDFAIISSNQFYSSLESNEQPTVSLAQQPQVQIETCTLPQTRALPFSFFTSYIYSGTLTPSLLAVSEKDCDCTLEALWELGYHLRAPGFMNFCMEELREVVSDGAGGWPSAFEAKRVWRMKLGGEPWLIDSRPEMGNGSQEAVSAGGINASDSTREPISKASSSTPSNNENTPLHAFAAACIAHKAPLSQPLHQTMHNYWRRLFLDFPSLSLAVHQVDVRRFTDKEKVPWDDEFRSEWMVSEVPIGELWRGAVEKRPSATVTEGSGKGKEVAGSRGMMRGREKAVCTLLERWTLTGERGYGDSDESESADSKDGDFIDDADKYAGRGRARGWRRRRA